MRGREYEERLRLLAAPAPNARARAQAKDAALAEFERVHAIESDVGTKAPRRAGFFERLVAWLMGREPGGSGAGARPGWRPSALLGGLASVLVAVFGLMSIWPMITGRQPVPSLEDSAQPRLATGTARPAPASPAPAAEASAVTSGSGQDSAPHSATHESGRPGADERRAEAPMVDAPQVNAPHVDAILGNAAVRAPPAAAPRSAGDGPAARGDVADAPAEKAADDAGLMGARSRAANANPAPVVAATIVDESKRAPMSAIDAIQSEDIGELADTNVAESLRRRPAVAARSLVDYNEMNPVQRTTDARVSTFSVDVDTASYWNVRKQLESGELPAKETVRVEELINYFDYSWPLPQSREQPFEPTVIVSDSPWNGGKKLVHIGVKGFQLDARQRPNANVVMLIDTSSSMDEIGRLPLVKESARLMLSSLKSTDTVAIVVYPSTTGVVLEPTPVSERQKIWQALETLKPMAPAAPGTPGIKLAYDVAAKSFLPDGMNRVLLCTDRHFNAGMKGLLGLRRLVERQREQGIFLSVVAFGVGAYRDERAVALAQQGNGIAASVEDAQAAREVLVEQATGTLFTIAEEVRIQVEFNPATVAEWRLVGYEARELKRGGFNEDNVNAGDIASGHTATAIYEITPARAQSAGPDQSRYAPVASAKPGRGPLEYGYLKIRYKLPGGFRSRVIEQPIEIEPLRLSDALRRDVEFSTAVAGFAQLLRGGRYTGGLTYEDVVRQAESARGDDPSGYRAEFVRLVRQAQRAERKR